MSRYHDIARELGLDGSMAKQASCRTVYSDPMACEIMEFLKQANAEVEEYPLSMMLQDIQKSANIDIDPEILDFVERSEVAGFSKSEIEEFLHKQSAPGVPSVLSGLYSKLQGVLGVGTPGAYSKAMKSGILDTESTNIANSILNEAGTGLSRINQQFAKPTFGERAMGFFTGQDPLKRQGAIYEKQIGDLIPLIQNMPNSRSLAQSFMKAQGANRWQNQNIKDQIVDLARVPKVTPAPATTVAGKGAQFWDSMDDKTKKMILAGIAGGGLGATVF